jgi:hypothetical protein
MRFCFGVGVGVEVGVRPSIWREYGGLTASISSGNPLISDFVLIFIYASPIYPICLFDKFFYSTFQMLH